MKAFQLWWVPAMAVALAACGGPSSSSDAGEVVVNDGGGGGGSGGADAGEDAGQSNEQQIAFGQLCTNAAAGFRESVFEETASCGKPITRADLDHLFYAAYPDYNFYFSHQQAFAGSDCSVTDGGLAVQMSRYAEAIAAGRLGYEPSKAYLCRQNGRERDGGLPDFAVCEQVFAPKVAAGGTCKASYECIGDTYCKPTNEQTCEGICVAHLAIGAACSPVRDLCVSAASCTQGADGGYQCVELLNAGDDCTDDDECKSGMVCFDDGVDSRCTQLEKLAGTCMINVDGDHTCDEGVCVTSDGGTSGVCTAAATLGQPCGDNLNGKPECDSCFGCSANGTCVEWGRTGGACGDDDDCFDPRIWFCNAGTCQVRPRQGEACLGGASNGGSGNCMYYDNYCKKNAAGGAGTPGLCSVLPKLGEACGTAFDQTTSCAEGYCRANTGTCAPYAKVNEPCTTSSSYNGLSPECEGEDLFCDTRADAGGTGTNGTCRNANPVGSACATGLPCASDAFCGDGGVCAALLAEGVSCAQDSQCQSALCDGPADGGRVCIVARPNGAACDTDKQCQSETCDELTKKCTSTCGVEANDAGGCMNYDLRSLSIYLVFAAVVMPLLRRRRR